MNHNFNKAFTLVELIVVIAILAVLATVAFISFQGYTSSSRDSVRLSDLKNISKSFELNRTKGIDFPLPDKKVDISSSGTIFQYQGELSQNILNSDLNIFDGGVDPLTGENYGYAVNSARNKYQIIGFLENGANIANISLNKTFADNSDKYVKSSGDTLGILLDPTTNEIITDENNTLEIDLQTNTNSYSFVDFHNKIQEADSGFLVDAFKFRYNSLSSCKAILNNQLAKGNGIYTINPTGVDGEEFEVYCDMTTDGGGWTLFYANSSNTNMLVKKSYMNYFSELNGIDFSSYDFNDYNLNGMVDYNALGANAVMAQEIGNWDSGDFSTIEFANSSVLDDFLSFNLNIDYNNNCQDIGSEFTFRNSNGTQYTLNEMLGFGNPKATIGFGQCHPDYVQHTLFSDVEDYPRDYFYNVSGAQDNFRVRGVGGFNGNHSDIGTVIARYFVR